jgi:hypothetical protein
MPKQMDEFLCLLTGTEPSEFSEVVSVAIPTVPSESHPVISNRVPAEPSKTGPMLSNSSIAGPSEVDGLLLSPSPASPKELQDPFTTLKSATPNEKDERSAPLNSTETRAVGDVAAMSKMATPTELENLFATFGRPGRGTYESRPTLSAGIGVAGYRNAIRIGKIEIYLASVAVIVFVGSLLIYWMRPSQDVSRNPEVTAQDSGDSRLGSQLPATVVEGNPGAKQGEGIQWQGSALQPSTGDRSLNRRVRGSTSESSLPSAASNPARIAAMKTTEADQPAGQKAIPARKQANAEKKKVTADDLITDKKKITVDDLINDN